MGKLFLYIKLLKHDLHINTSSQLTHWVSRKWSSSPSAGRTQAAEEHAPSPKSALPANCPLRRFILTMIMSNWVHIVQCLEWIIHHKTESREWSFDSQIWFCSRISKQYWKCYQRLTCCYFKFCSATSDQRTVQDQQVISDGSLDMKPKRLMN